MVANKGHKKGRGQADKASVAPVDNVDADIEVQLSGTSESVDDKREKVRKSERKTSGFMAFVRKADPIAMTCFVAIMLASIVVLGGYVNANYINPEWNSPVAVNGDTVKVEYVGSYGNYYDKEGAVIFDTNVKSVNDGDEYFKSPSYKDKDKFESLSFTVGGTDVLKQFGDAVIGKLINWEARVAISPENGYGTAVMYKLPSLKVTLNMSGEMLLADFNEYTGSNFSKTDLANSQVTTMPNGLLAEVNLSGHHNNSVTYTYVNVDASDTSKLFDMETDDNVQFKVLEKNDTTFLVEYVPVNNSKMFRAINCDENGAEQLICIDDMDGDGEYEYKNVTTSNSNNEEQKGEVLYFWMKIVDINDYAKNRSSDSKS